MTTTYRVVEAGATEPEDLERWLNAEAAGGWRVASVMSVPANKVDVRVGGSFFNPERQSPRGYWMPGAWTRTWGKTVVQSLRVTLERTT